ncbi:MAG: phosphotransferase [Candidatus Krumholzibacteriota bacterium]
MNAGKTGLPDNSSQPRGTADLEVVVLAGGVGHRFGGAKQLVPVAPDGATLLEVTLRDAHRAGCRHAVIVTAPQLERDIRSLFAARPIRDLQLDVVLQIPDDLPSPSPVCRTRPWGTAHAAWSVRRAVTGPFLLFNADDHYGPNAPTALAAALTETDSEAVAGPIFAMLGYPLASTLSREGTVSRAVCEVDDDGWLIALEEHLAIDGEGRITTGPERGSSLPQDKPVSMNAWAFTPDIFPLLEDCLTDFLATANLETDECHLPAAVDRAIRSGKAGVRVRTAPDSWCGMTWPRDRQRVARRLEKLESPLRIIRQFGLDVADSPARPFGKGLIHTTWRVDTVQGPHLVQRLNHRVFPDPIAVAENAAVAARRVDEALRRRGEADPRKRLTFREGSEDRPWLRDDDGDVWRVAALIPDSRPPLCTNSAEIFDAARLLGQFLELVNEGPGPRPREILPGFHDTPSRLAALRSSAESDNHGRLGTCRPEYDRLVALASLAGSLPRESLPVRLVHNDAKLDNVLVDTETGKALCVVDLDTVMPGCAVFDFGDLVRSSVTGRPEDEPDPDLITIREDIFHDLASGYLEGADGWISRPERFQLVAGAIVITYEQSLRFLADHLGGDIYYPVDEPGHNLRRARAQLSLLEALLASREAMQHVIDTI